MTRLSRATLAGLGSAVAHLPAPTATGIVHFGPGAFHRAHQAAYIDTVLADDPRWGIAAVSLRSRGTVQTLAAQDGLYSLAVRDAEPSLRVIGAHTRFLGLGDAAEIRALLGAPAVRMVTTTVTEKGYCLAPNGTLDFAHPDIVRDLGGAAVPQSVIGWIVAGLAARRSSGMSPFVPVPCDNLPGNGAKLHAALVAFAGMNDPALADWIAGEVRVPATMVDSITPASDAALYADVAAALGVEDYAAVQRESFAQWVIEDIGASFGPDLAGAGVILTDDVAGYEQAKLRILNGAHSTLAYVGLLRGAVSVADAMRDVALSGFVDAMIQKDIMPILPTVRGLDLNGYRKAVLERFRNPVIVHRLDQIAQDGTQKLPYRLGDTLRANRRAGRMPGHVVAALGSWVAFLIRRSRQGVAIVDPAGARLSAIAIEGTPSAVIDRLVAENLGLSRVLADDPELLAALDHAASAAMAGDWRTVFSL